MQTPKMVNQKALSCLLILTGALVLVITIVLLQTPDTVQGVSSDLSNARSVYPAIEDTRLDSCTLCHTSGSSLNSYGRAYDSAGSDRSALTEIENRDSDGDGFTNIVEIKALTFPGNSSSKPVQQPTATRAPTRTPTRTPTPFNPVRKPVADTYVNQIAPSTVYGASRQMLVDHSPVNRAYLRFRLTGVNLPKVTKAVLRLYVVNGSAKGFLIRTLRSNTWDEKKVIYTNAPPPGDIVGRWDKAVPGKWIALDVTRFVKGPGDGDYDEDDIGKGPLKDWLSMSVSGLSTDGIIFASRETGATAPQLVITMSK